MGRFDFLQTELIHLRNIIGNHNFTFFMPIITKYPETFSLRSISDLNYLKKLDNAELMLILRCYNFNILRSRMNNGHFNCPICNNYDKNYESYKRFLRIQKYIIPVWEVVFIDLIFIFIYKLYFKNK